MNSQTSISFEYLEYAFLVDQENTACKKTIKTAQIQWTIGEPAAELFRRDRKLFQQDELFDKLPNNIDDPVQWFEFRRQIIEIKKRCGLTMYVNALNALLKNYDKPSALMYFVMAMLLHFRNYPDDRDWAVDFMDDALNQWKQLNQGEPPLVFLLSSYDMMQSNNEIAKRERLRAMILAHPSTQTIINNQIDQQTSDYEDYYKYLISSTKLFELKISTQLRNAPVVRDGFYPGEQYTPMFPPQSPDDDPPTPFAIHLVNIASTLYSDANTRSRRAHYALWNAIIDQYNQCPTIMERLLSLLGQQISRLSYETSNVSPSNRSSQLIEIDQMLERIDIGLRKAYLIQVKELRYFRESHPFWLRCLKHTDYRYRGDSVVEDMIQDHLAFMGDGDTLRSFHSVAPDEDENKDKNFNNVEPIITTGRAYKAYVAVILPELFDVRSSFIDALVYRPPKDWDFNQFWHKWYEYCVKYMPIKRQLETELVPFILNQYWLSANKNNDLGRKILVLLVLRKQYTDFFKHICIMHKHLTGNPNGLSWIDRMRSIFINFTNDICHAFQHAADSLSGTAAGHAFANEAAAVSNRSGIVFQNSNNITNISLVNYINTIMTMPNSHQELLQFSSNSINDAFQQYPQFNQVHVSVNEFHYIDTELLNQRRGFNNNLFWYMSSMNANLRQHRLRLINLMSQNYRLSAFLPVGRRDVCRRVLNVLAESFTFPGHEHFITPQERSHLQQRGYEKGRLERNRILRLRAYERRQAQLRQAYEDEQQSKRPRLQ